MMGVIGLAILVDVAFEAVDGDVLPHGHHAADSSVFIGFLDATGGFLRTATRVFPGLEAGIGCRPCLLGGCPQPIFQRICGGVFFRWGDPVHAAGSMVFQINSAAN